MTSKSCFSIKTAILGTVLHFVLTHFFALLIFIRAMGAFTHSVSDEMAFWNLFMWVWSPLARAGFMEEDTDLAWLKLLAFLWSMVVGLMAGWLRPNFRH